MDETGKLRISFIINPISGGKKKAGIEEYLRDSVNTGQYDICIFHTEYSGHASVLAYREIDRGAKIVVAIGGDGTINEIAGALSGTETILGIIPCGSGNGIARHFKIPLNYRKALKLLFCAEPVNMDVAYLNEMKFFGTSGIGFDADIAQLFKGSKNRGIFSYAISFIRAFLGYKSKKYVVLADGDQFEEDAFLINVANISQFGYHFHISPRASATDGYLDLIIVKKFPLWKMPVILMRSYLGTIDKSKYIDIHRAKSVTILEPKGKKIVHVDGEPLVVDEEIKFGVKPGFLKILIPQQ
jgi:YegS/Rv2252/BmrU family lipid kinase